MTSTRVLMPGGTQEPVMIHHNADTDLLIVQCDVDGMLIEPHQLTMINRNAILLHVGSINAVVTITLTS